ncbi:MAG: hypothetical protein WAW37_01955, partial [Syntrophobacteraceae bacterium]
LPRGGIVQFIHGPQSPSAPPQPKQGPLLIRQRQVAVYHREHRLFVFGQFSGHFFKKVNVVCDL